MKIDELEEITEIDIKDYIDFRENVKSNMEHPEWLGDFTIAEIKEGLESESMKIWVYKSNNEKEARENLEKVKDKWNSIYPTSLKVWEDNWEAICTLFNYSKELRRIMYTTNAIESLNRSYRKYTKTKGVFTSDNSLMKCLFLATKNVEKKWTTRYPNWDMIYNELNILYPERLN